MDETLRRKAPRVALLVFDTAEDGVMEETKCSVARRIHDLLGFGMSDVGLMEGDTQVVAMLGRGYRVFTAVSFVVRGLGWRTDFRELYRAPEFDEGE